MMWPVTYPAGIVEREFPCAGCEYDVRGLPTEGRCPECGEAMEVSLRGDTLHHADPRWLGRLIIAGWLIPAGVAGMVLLMLAESIVPFSPSATWRAVVGAAMEIAQVVVMWAGPALLLLQRPNRFLDRPGMRRVGLGGITTLSCATLSSRLRRW